MNSGRMTVILLAVTIVLALAVPALRESLGERSSEVFSPTHGSPPSVSRLAEIVAEAPRDARLHYAYALALSAEVQSSGRLGPPQEPVKGPAVRDAFSEAIALAPDDPAPRLSLAVFEIDQAGIERLPDEKRTDADSYVRPTSEQLERVRRARELLDEVRALDPRNAVSDYLLAWTWLAEGRPDRARAAAARGAAKDRWTTYQTEGATGIVELLDRTSLADETTPMAAISLSVSQTYLLSPRLRSIARALRDRADDLRRQGDDTAAIGIYETLLHMGHLMRVDAHQLIDGLLAVALTAVTVSSDDWAPPNEAQLLSGDEDLTKTDLRLPRFAAYLREHDRADLSAYAEAEIEAGRRWQAQTRDLPERMMNDLVEDISGGPMMNAMAVWLTTALMLCVAALIGLLSLFARYWREPRGRSGWSHVRWLGLLALLVLPGQAMAWIAMRRVVSRGVEAGSTVLSMVIGGVALGILLWALGVLALTLRERRGTPPEDRLGGPRSFLRGLRALTCPTLAALILLCMPATLAIEHNLDRMAAKHRQLAIEGEVQYYHLQANAQAVQSESSDTDGG